MTRVSLFGCPLWTKQSLETNQNKQDKTIWGNRILNTEGKQRKVTSSNTETLPTARADSSKGMLSSFFQGVASLISKGLNGLFGSKKSAIDLDSKIDIDDNLVEGKKPAIDLAYNLNSAADMLHYTITINKSKKSAANLLDCTINFKDGPEDILGGNPTTVPPGKKFYL